MWKTKTIFKEKSTTNQCNNCIIQQNSMVFEIKLTENIKMIEFILKTNLQMLRRKVLKQKLNTLENDQLALSIVCTLVNLFGF